MDCCCYWIKQFFWILEDCSDVKVAFEDDKTDDEKIEAIKYFATPVKKECKNCLLYQLYISDSWINKKKNQANDGILYFFGKVKLKKLV